MDKLSGSISKEWIALILLPMVNCIAGGHSVFHLDSPSDGSEECLTAISVSRKDHLTLSISVAVGSTIVSWSTVTKSSRVLTSVQTLSANCSLCDPVRRMIGSSNPMFSDGISLLQVHGDPWLDTRQTSSASFRPL
jgi:hypothetical protein